MRHFRPITTLICSVLALAVLLLATTRPAHAALPWDAMLNYDAYVPGQGWLPRVYDGGAVGPQDTSKRITGIRARIDQYNVGPYYPGFSVCYRVKQAGRSWSSEACNGNVAGSLGAGQVEFIQVRFVTPADVAANVCYGVNGGSQWEAPRCDGGATGMLGLNVVGFYIYSTGGDSRGRHTRSVSELTGAQRSFLSTKISECITQEVLDHHGMINHWSGPELLAAHRHMVRDMLEPCLVSRGAGAYVPLPFWNPGEVVPAELRSVKQVGGSSFPPLQLFETWQANFDTAKPASIVQWDVCWIPSLEELADAVRDWHNSVHDAVGGVMADTTNSPASVIFWPWHAYVDNVYTQWEQCRVE